jgi:hypothetical protein
MRREWSPVADVGTGSGTSPVRVDTSRGVGVGVAAGVDRQYIPSRRVAVGVTTVDTAAVRAYLVEHHAAVVEAVRGCAAASTAAETREERDTSAVRRGIEARLREAGVWERLPGVLAGCVDHVGRELQATPVAAPPYVAPTATGVVLRATLESGRLVVAVDALSVDRGGTGVRLRPRPPETPLAELVRVEWR